MVAKNAASCAKLTTATHPLVTPAVESQAVRRCHFLSPTAINALATHHFTSCLIDLQQAASLLALSSLHPITESLLLLPGEQGWFG